MNNETFEKLLVSLEGLTGKQRDLVSGRVKVLAEHADTTRLAVERLGNPATCPHCADTRGVRFGRVRGQQRMRCKSCGKTFTLLTGTPFLRLRDEGKLLAYAGCMSHSETIRSAASAVKLTVDRSFRWRHRFLKFLAGQRPQGMTGIVEADETFFRRSYKGQRHGLPRPAKKRGGPPPDGPDDGWVPVLVAMQRGSRTVTDGMLKDTSAASMTVVLRPALGPDAVLSTDGKSSYPVVAKNLGIEAGSFVASYHGHGGNGVWHVQNVNAYDRRLKSWMGRFYGVATKYLHHYLGWRRLLDRFNGSVTAEQFLYHALRPEYVNT